MPRQATGQRSGHKAGQANAQDNYIRPPKPRTPAPTIVDEIRPFSSTYGAWTGDIAVDEVTPPKGAPSDAYFDDAAATRAVEFIERLHFFDGVFAGHAFKLQRWQRRIVRYIFGWKRADGSRLIRRVYLEVPRKNGKSTFAAAVALLLAFEDDEPGAQVYFAAADKDQAHIAYNAARIMAQGDKELAKRSRIYNSTKRILIEDTNSELRCLSSDTKKLYGLNLHGLIFDELMAQPNRVLWDALTSAQGSRWQPLILAITTAGWDRQSVAFEQREYTRLIEDGGLEDPSFLGVVYSCDEEADWTLPETWLSSSPSIGATVQVEYYEEKAKEAQGQPSAQNSFRTLLLSQWVGQATRLIPMPDWDATEDEDPGSLAGRTCFGGLDLSSSIDLTAFVLDFPLEGGRHFWLPRIFVPEDNLRDRSLKDRAPYEVWVRDGFIIPTPGNVIDYEYVRAAVRAAAEEYDLRDVSYDRWGATQLATELEADGLTLVRMGQGFASMSGPTKEMLRLIADHKLLTNGHPVLRWMADNAAGQQDPAGNIKLARDRSGSRIDGLVAGVMALDGAMRRAKAPVVSVYETRGPDDIWKED